MDGFFSVFTKNRVWGILGPPYCGIGATIRIGREMLCLPYAGFFFQVFPLIGILVIVVGLLLVSTVPALGYTGYTG